jgi:hypothetical protein
MGLELGELGDRRGALLVASRSISRTTTSAGRADSRALGRAGARQWRACGGSSSATTAATSAMATSAASTSKSSGAAPWVRVRYDLRATRLGLAGLTMSDLTIGKCALCGFVRALKESHIVPAWMYRRAIQTNPSGPPSSLVRIERESKTAILSNKQDQEHLLCGECEHRFGMWETYVSTIATKADGTFPALAQTTGIWQPTASPIWRAGDASALDCDLLARFSISVIWRSAVSSGANRVKLGPYEPAVRAYLLDTGPVSFPAKMTLVVQLFDTRPAVRVDRTIMFPHTRKVYGFHAHEWAGCGFRFYLLVGGQAPRFPGISFVATNIVLISDAGDLLDKITPLIQSAVPKGKLAKLKR